MIEYDYVIMQAFSQIALRLLDSLSNGISVMHSWLPMSN